MTYKFIETFEIMIGQDPFRAFPCMISFIINDTCVTCRLEDFKNWINAIYDSNGNRSEEAYSAKKSLDRFFHQLLEPWKKLPEIKKEKDLTWELK